MEILKIIITREVDTDPVLEGTYDDEAKSLYAIDRLERKDWLVGQYRYFNPPVENYKGIPEDELRKYCEQDYQRMESYSRQEWCMYFVEAKAQILLTSFQQTIRSGALGGIPSDASESDFEESIADRMEVLKGELKAIGFTDKQINAARQERKGW